MSDNLDSDNDPGFSENEPSPAVLAAIQRRSDYERRRNEFRSALNGYFDQGLTSGQPSNIGESWTESRLVGALNVSYQTATNWRYGHTFPLPANFNGILRLLFGTAYKDDARAVELIHLFQMSAPFYYRDPEYVNTTVQTDDPAQTRSPERLPENDIDDIETAVLQLPAAFRFAVHEQKIDALPENVQTVDDSVARDLHQELREKLAQFLLKLGKSNSDPYVIRAAECLLNVINIDFEEIRPGVVLSRARTIEVIQAGYDTDEGRSELFPDALSALSDVHLSAQDFLATFPVIRQIERERISLGIERDPTSIRYLRNQADEITMIARESEIVAEGAVRALAENEEDIQQARTNELAANLLADKILVVRNFASEVLRASYSGAASFSHKAWSVVGPDFEIGAKSAARMLPPLAVIALMVHIVGPIIGLAGLLKGDVFKAVATAMQRRQANIAHEHKLD